MTTPQPTRRSVYADKLHAFSDFAFGDDAAFQNRGRWREYFGRRIGPRFDGRLVFEIGCSDGDFLNRIARKFPRTGFIGLDWKARALYYAAGRSATTARSNIALIRGRGQDILKVFAECEVDEFWVFHPDPCDRPVELKNRLIAEPFLTDAHRVLRDEQSIIALKTDHPGYYQWVLGLFGLPEPDWFAMARDRTSAGVPATAPTAAAARRVRVADLMSPEDIPHSSDAVRRLFTVTTNAPDFWHDPGALAHAAGRMFAGEATAYESRFLIKRSPIYYVEMCKTRPIGGDVAKPAVSKREFRT